MKWMVSSLCLLVLLLVVSGVLAMESVNYRLDWFTALTTAAGGAAGSTNYAGSWTVGPSAVGVSSSTSHGACLGYWCGEFSYCVFLPIVLQEF